MNRISRLSSVIILVLVISLIGSLFIITPVKAQDPLPLPTLSIQTQKTDVCVGSEITVRVHVADVVDLYGYDISLTYDPDAIEVLGLSNSGWLTSAYVLESDFNTPGFLRYAATRMFVSGGVSGSGDLINIQIRVKAPAENIQFSFVQTGDFPTELVNSSVESMDYLIGDTGSTLTHACKLHFPDSIRIVCGGTSIPVMIEDIFDAYGYDLTITYDPSVIEVTNVVFDTSFFELTLLPFIDFSTPGVIRALGSRTNPEDAISGSGPLINITVIEKITNAESGLTIQPTSEFTDRNGFGISPINVENYPIWTYPCDPNAVDLLYFDVLRKKVRAYLTWETANELDNAGFNIYRSGRLDGIKRKINPELIPAEAAGTTMGALYEYKDKPLKPWKTYYYWLEWIDFEGNATLSDPVKAAPPLVK